MNSTEPITKMEEHRALQAIRDTLIPRVVARYNATAPSNKKVTVEILRKTLKKYSQTPGNDSESMALLYVARPNPEQDHNWAFYFDITRSGPTNKPPVGKIMINCRSPAECICSTYLKESIEAHDWGHFSRKEEDYAVAFMKREVIPYIVNRKNIMLKASNKRPQILRVADVLLTLKKVQKHQTKHGIILIFKGEGQKQQYNLAIYKNGEGDILIWNRDNGQHWQVGKPIPPFTKKDLSEAFKIDESIDPKEQGYTLSKIDEQRGFQFIRQIVVPSMVVAWNKAVERSRFKEKELYKVSIEEINKALIKKEHYKHNPGDKTRHDWILYQSTPVKPFVFKGPFQFSLSKDVWVGELSVAAALPGSDSWTSYYIGDKEHRASQPNLKSIKRGTNIKENVEKDDPLDIHRFSRREEGEAVQFIKQVILPHLVNKKYGKGRAEHYIDDFRHNLKKIEERSNTHGIVLIYVSQVLKHGYNLAIYKDHDGSIMIYNRNNGEQWRVGKSIPPDKEDLTEGKRKYKPLPITKTEESAAFDYIKKIMIPLVIKHYDEYRGNHIYEPITADDIRKHLKKIEIVHEYGQPSLTVVFEAEVPSKKYAKHGDKTFKFYVSKNENNEILIRWKHPFYFSFGHYQKDQHGYYIDTDYDKMDEDHKSDLKEETEDNIPTPDRCRMTRRDIDQAVHYIKRLSIPQIVWFWNDKHQNDSEITVEEIIKNLKQVKIGSDIRKAVVIKNDETKGKTIKTNCEYVMFSSTTKDMEIFFTVNKDFAGYMRLNVKMPGLRSVPTKINKPVMVFESIYNEPPDENGLPPITPKEEKEALQYIRQYMVPMAVKYHNGVNNKSKQVSEQEVQENLKLAGKYPSHEQENPSLSYVSVPKGLYFAFMVHKQLQNTPDKGKLYVRFRTPDAMSPHEYYVGTPPLPLYEGKNV